MTREIKFRCWDKKVEAMRDDVAVYSKGVHIFGEGWKKFEDFIPMQFTGLLDKNGEEIYEGDIVKCLDGYNATVAYDEIHAEFDPFGSSDGAEWGDGVEILGNVYEHPNLLTT